MLGTKEIERLAGWTTRAGLTTEIAGVKEVAAPYMEMNTKELLLEGAKLVKMGGVEVRPNPNPDPNPDPNLSPNPSPSPSPSPNRGAGLVNASILQPSYARVDGGLSSPPGARDERRRAAPYVAEEGARDAVRRGTSRVASTPRTLCCPTCAAPNPLSLSP